LNHVAQRIDFRCGDGLKAIQEFKSRSDVVYFIDPPYTAGGKKAGRRLYKHYEINHERLFAICESLKGDFLITYDHAEEVKSMARAHGFQMHLIPMTNTHHAIMEELVIGKNLSWMDGFPSVHEPEVEYVVKKKKGKTPTRANPTG
jgi:DNA adenine methylase